MLASVLVMISVWDLPPVSAPHAARAGIDAADSDTEIGVLQTALEG
ncbi:hypothetical protein [Leptolyngbya sp. FACHB-261]|nr:hypothetical protein [Leptolyngbya sp. FACHB-261]